MNALAQAFACIDEAVGEPVLRAALKRALMARHPQNPPQPSLADAAAWLDDLAEAALRVAYALRVDDYPRTQARTARLLSAHDRLKDALAMPYTEGR